MIRTSSSILGMAAANAVLLAAFVAAPAHAAPPTPTPTVFPACSANDISATAYSYATLKPGVTYVASTGPTTFGSFDCEGFVGGNIFNNGAKATLVPLLNSLSANFTTLAGFNIGDYEKLSGLGGLQALDFGTTLYGKTIIGVHYGAGGKSPSDLAGNSGNAKSDMSALYLFDAGVTGLDKIYIGFGASSNAVLFSTEDAPVLPPVPEPATWAMMIIGMGVVGSSLRRRTRMMVSFS